MSKFRVELNFWTLIAVTSILILAIFLIYPLYTILSASFKSSEVSGFTLKNYISFFYTKYYRSTLFNSLFVSFFSTIGALIIGVPLAYILTRYRIPGKALINTLVILPLISPPFIGAYAWVMLFGRAGLITVFLRNLGIPLPTIYGWKGIIFVFTLHYFPFVFLLTSSALKSMDQSLEDASRNLGVSEFKTFRRLILPIISPSILTGALLVFMSALAEFGTPMIIGEAFRVLPTMAYSEFINEMGGNPSMAGTLSVILICCSTLILLLQRAYMAKRVYSISIVRTLEVKELTPFKKYLATAFSVAIITIALLPLAVIFVISFAKAKGPVLYPEFSLENYRQVFYGVPRAIFNTFFLSSLSTLLNVIFGMLIGYLLVRKSGRLRSLLDSIVMIPYAIPGTVIGIGLIVAFNKKPLILTGTFIILVISYFIRRLPYSVRASAAILHQVDISVEQASINLGVSPMRTFFKVTVYLMAPGILAGAVMAWVTTISELSSTIVLYYGPWSTMTVDIYKYALYDLLGKGSALSAILIVAVFVPLLILNRIIGEKKTVLF